MTIRALAYGPTPLSLPADTPIAEVLAHMFELGTNHVALRDAAGRFSGMVSARSILDKIVPVAARIDHGLSDLAFAGDALPMLVDHFHGMQAVPAIQLADHDITALHVSTPLTETVLMLSRAEGPLPVLDDDDHLVGVLGPRAMLAFLANQAETN